MEHLDQRCKGEKIMKKYTQPATNIFLSLTLICIVMIVAGAVTFFMAPEQLNLILFFWELEFLSALCLSVFGSPAPTPA